MLLLTWNELDYANEFRANELGSQIEKVRKALARIVKERKRLHDAEGHGGHKRKKRKSARKLRHEALRRQLVFFDPPQQEQLLSEDILLEIKLRVQNGECLSKHFVQAILHAMKTLLRKGSSAVARVRVPSECRFTICGDTHGQLADVLTIWKLNHPPSPSNWYLFNGDFVDRGPSGTEVALLLFCYKLLYPKAVHLNRGNHEAESLNERYNFMDEVRMKYGKKVFHLFQDVFCLLPLCTVVNNEIFTVHGGLFSANDVTLDDLELINHKRQPPHALSSREDFLFKELLWSDPREISGVEASNRGAGVYFGGDVTKQFLERNKLRLLIRSHEMMEEGYKVTHDCRTITVFSASNYCGTNNNYGAFISFSHTTDGLTPQFVKFKADQHRRVPRTLFDETKLELQTFQMLHEKIFEHYDSLHKAFSERCHHGTTRLSRIAWSEVLRQVTGLQVPWLCLQWHLADLEPDRTIDYQRFLRRYSLSFSSQLSRSLDEVVISDICSAILDLVSSSEGIREIYSRFDTNGDSSLSYDELREALSSLNLGLSPHSIEQIIRSTDVDGDEQIDLDEFSARFQETFETLKHQREKWVMQALADLEFIMVNKPTERHSIKRYFKEHGSAHGKSLSVGQFGKLVKHLLGKHAYSKEQRTQIAAFVDSNGSGRISSKELKAAFKRLRCSEAALQWKQEVIGSISNFFFKNRLNLKKAFEMFDFSQSGKVTMEDFKAGIKAINDAMTTPLSDIQIERVYQSIDKDGNGLIQYDEFLRSFEDVQAKNHGFGASVARTFSNRHLRNPGRNRTVAASTPL